MERSKLSVHQAIETVDLAASGERNKFHLSSISRLEAHRGSRRDAQSEPTRLLTIELKGVVGFEEMEVTAHLNWAIPTIRDNDLSYFETDIRIVWLAMRCDSDFSRDHRIG
jgi:hypothetical protein